MHACDGRLRKKGRMMLQSMLVPLVPLVAAVLSVHIGSASAQMAAPTEGSSHAHVQAVREIDDPHSGFRWLLLRDSIRPGGPGCLVPVADPEGDVPVPIESQSRTSSARIVHPPAPPVIRGGDRLIVEENTGVVEARLEAVALSPAAVGFSLQARLKIGGKLVRVVALAPGRAALAPQIEVRP
jgi:hypothetical protein